MKNKLFTDKVLAPLFLGAIIAVVGIFFESDPIIWIGTGIHCFGWFVMLRDG